MSNREVGIPAIVGWLVLFWGALAALFAFVTANTAPGLPELAWKDAAPVTTTKLQVLIATAAPDADGDEVEYLYTWKRNGEVVEGKKSDTIASRDLRADDVWEVTVTPTDGTIDSYGCAWPWRECAGQVSTSLQVTIGNTPPRARVRFVDAQEAPLEGFDGRTDVMLDLSCFDPDILDKQRDGLADALAAKAAAPEDAEEEEEEDPCTYEVAWFAGEVSIEVDEEGAVSITKAVEVPEGELPGEPVPAEPVSTERTMAGRDLRASDTWTVVVIANDGTDAGPPTSEVFTKSES